MQTIVKSQWSLNAFTQLAEYLSFSLFLSLSLSSIQSSSPLTSFLADRMCNLVVRSSSGLGKGGAPLRSGLIGPWEDERKDCWSEYDLPTPRFLLRGAPAPARRVSMTARTWVRQQDTYLSQCAAHVVVVYVRLVLFVVGIDRTTWRSGGFRAGPVEWRSGPQCLALGCAAAPACVDQRLVN